MSERYKPHTYEGETPAERPQQEIYNLTRSYGLEGLERDIRQCIRNINEDILFEIFREYYGKSGFNPDTVDPIPLRQITIFNDLNDGRIGAFSPNPQSILLNAARCISSEGSVSTETVVNTIIHEEVHAISAIYLKKISSEVTEVKIDLGLEKRREYSDTGFILDKQTNLLANEGLTQIIADDIQAEYVRRSGTTHDYPNKEQTGRLGISAEAYPENQFRIRLLIKFYAYLLDQDEEVVKNSFIRSYLRNTNIFPEELDDVPTEFEPRVRNFDIEFYLNNQNISTESLISKLLNMLPHEKQGVFEQHAEILKDNFLEATRTKKE